MAASSKKMGNLSSTFEKADRDAYSGLDHSIYVIKKPNPTRATVPLTKIPCCCSVGDNSGGRRLGGCTPGGAAGGGGGPLRRPCPHCQKHPEDRPHQGSAQA
jgi:hypothetical protein